MAPTIESGGIIFGSERTRRVEARGLSRGCRSSSRLRAHLLDEGGDPSRHRVVVEVTQDFVLQLARAAVYASPLRAMRRTRTLNVF